MDAATRDPTAVLARPLVQAMPLLLRPQLPETGARQTGRTDSLASGALVRERRPLVPVPVMRLSVTAGLAVRDVAPAAPRG